MARMDPLRLSVSERESTALKAALLELKREVPSDADLEALRGQILQRLGFEHSDSGVRRLPAALRSGAFDLAAAAPYRDDDRGPPIAASSEGLRARALGRRRRAHHCTVLVGALLAAAAVALLVMTRNGGLLEVPPSALHSRENEPPAGSHSAPSSPPELPPPAVAPASTPAVAEVAPDSKHANGAREDGPRIVRSRRRVAGSRDELSASTRTSGGEALRAPGVININSIPFTRVVLDGRVLGGTPLVGVTVSPGEHTVLFVDYDGERRLKKVNVDPGRTVLAAVRFD